MASSFCVSHQELCTTMSELAVEVRKIVKEVSRFSPSSLNSWFPFASAMLGPLVLHSTIFLPVPITSSAAPGPDGQKSANSWLFS